MAHGPDLLVLDEPFDGLDPVARHDLVTLVRHWAVSSDTTAGGSELATSRCARAESTPRRAAMTARLRSTSSRSACSRVMTWGPGDSGMAAWAGVAWRGDSARPDGAAAGGCGCASAAPEATKSISIGSDFIPPTPPAPCAFE
jgi:hypothetical protein